MVTMSILDVVKDVENKEAAKEVTKVTNADHIRGLSVEELAKSNLLNCPYNDGRVVEALPCMDFLTEDVEKLPPISLESVRNKCNTCVAKWLGEEYDSEAKIWSCERF